MSNEKVSRKSDVTVKQTIDNDDDDDYKIPQSQK